MSTKYTLQWWLTALSKTALDSTIFAIYAMLSFVIIVAVFVITYNGIESARVFFNSLK